MIKFTAKKVKDGREFIGIGLSRRNCELLLAGRPIEIDGKEMRMPIDVFIFAGETEDAMRKEIEALQSKPIPIIHHDTTLGTDREHLE